MVFKLNKLIVVHIKAEINVKNRCDLFFNYQGYLNQTRLTFLSTLVENESRHKPNKDWNIIGKDIHSKFQFHDKVFNQQRLCSLSL